MVAERWASTDDRIAVRSASERHDADGTWFRSHGDEDGEFDAHGPVRTRRASIDDASPTEVERLLRRLQGPRPQDHPGLSDLGG